MTGWLKLVPAWAYWVLALGIVAGTQQLRVAAAQSEAAGAVSALADYRTDVSERDRLAAVAALHETKRRMAAIDEVTKHAEQQLEVARADAADAGAALERLQQRLAAAEQRSRAAGNTITAQLSQASTTTARVHADLLGRLGEAAGLYAAVADESRVRGLGCESAFDALGRGG